MGRQSWIVGYNTEAEREHILKTCREHNAIATEDRKAGEEDVGEELMHICETSFTKPYKLTLLGGMSKAILFGNGGGRCSTSLFFIHRNLTITEYTSAIGKRIGKPLPIINNDDNEEHSDLENLNGMGCLPI